MLTSIVLMSTIVYMSKSIPFGFQATAHALACKRLSLNVVQNFIWQNREASMQASHLDLQVQFRCPVMLPATNAGLLSR
jgi:hypothetical protein